jgi:uncharacterized membrane-anchored protein
MQSIHLPTLGPRYWVALCIASIFGANMGDFFARNLGLGHVAGLPFLAAVLAIVMIAERFDRMTHQVYYWIAIIIVRTAATNFADFVCGDLKWPRLAVMAGLTVIPALALAISWQTVWRGSPDKAARTLPVLRADLGYWICMFIAGTLGTVIGDYSSHNRHLDDGGAALLLSPIVAAFFLSGRGGLLFWLPFYWSTVVAIRAAGTAVGDYISGREMLGLPLSTLLTGVALVACLAVWREPDRSAQPVRVG